MNALKRPYQYIHSPGRRTLGALLFGFFVFAFLLFFQPFQMGSLEDGQIWALTLGFGAVTTGVMILLNVILPVALRSFFNAERWTVGRQIFWTTANISIIGLVNAWYFGQWQSMSMGVGTYLWFQLVTWVVGAIPVSVFVLWRERSLRKVYERKSETINSSLSELPKTSNESELDIEGENKEEYLKLALADLFYVQSMDNYIEIHFRKGQEERRLVFRGSLKSLEEKWNGISSIYRCHKSYLVNFQNVIHVSGNAQGYRLHFTEGDEGVPVSRSLNKQVKNRFAVHP